MIIKQQVNEAEYVGDITENKVGIDAKNIDFIATLLTSNLYSKPFASFLRETISNAYDSHIEAGTKEPIILLIEDSQFNEIRVSIRDFGVGISPDRFERIYRNIGSSTKRESNDFIGCFGIGRFSCLSCANVANITSYYNGVKYSYIMYKNNGGINIDKLSQEEGDFKNGLEVSVVTSVGYEDFDEAIAGLILFDNLYIEGKTSVWGYRNAINTFNKRKVVDHGNYYTVDEGLRVGYGRNYAGLGKVIYPLNSQYLQTNDIIIKFSIGDVDVTPNREALQFNTRTTDVINNKIDKIKQEWSDTASQMLSNTDLQTFYRFAAENFITLQDTRVNKSDITLNTSIIKIDNEPIPDDYNVFLDRFRFASIPRENVYRVMGTTKSRRYLDFRELLCSNYLAGLKADRVTKNTTLSYFRGTLKNCVVFNYATITELTNALCNSMAKAIYNITGDNLRKHIAFTLRHLPFKLISNDMVPADYIENVRALERAKRVNTETKGELVRIFNGSGYKQHDFDIWLGQIKHVPFVVYAVNSKDENDLYRHLADVLEYYYDTDRWKHPQMVTVKASMIPVLKGRKKFVHITDFLYLRNNFWSKMITMEMIYSTFLNNKADKDGMGFLRLSANTPLWRSFQARYSKQLRCYSQIIGLPTYKDIKTLYTEKGWLNDYDISYFTLTEEDFRIIKEMDDLRDIRSELVDAVIFKKYGKNDKLGIQIPKGFIYKYIKNECIQKQQLCSSNV